MTSRDFAYWLQGYFEIGDLTSNKPGEDPLTVAQVNVIRKHLNMVFKHEIDPKMGSALHQAELSQTHAGLARLAGFTTHTNC